MRASQMGEASMEMMDVIHQKSAEADKALFVQFNMEPHHNQAKSALEGRPIFEEREYIMIMVPGDKDSIVHRPAMESDKQRFWDRYERWKSKVGDHTTTGTPLKMVPWLNSSQVKELEYFNVYTLEQLAALSDNHAQKFMGINALRQRAKDAITASKESAPLTAIRAELDEKENQLQTAIQALKDQGARIELLERTLKDGPAPGQSKIS
jgi:biotin operon repressor